MPNSTTFGGGISCGYSAVILTCVLWSLIGCNVQVDVSDMATQVETLLGDCTKAKRVLKWEHRHTFDQLVKEMIESDTALMSRNPLA